jgi:hypothetical protein
MMSRLFIYMSMKLILVTKKNVPPIVHLQKQQESYFICSGMEMAKPASNFF